MPPELTNLLFKFKLNSIKIGRFYIRSIQDNSIKIDRPLLQAGTRCCAFAKHRVETFLQTTLTIKEKFKALLNNLFLEDCYSLDDILQI